MGVQFVYLEDLGIALEDLLGVIEVFLVLLLLLDNLVGQFAGAYVLVVKKFGPAPDVTKTLEC